MATKKVVKKKTAKANVESGNETHGKVTKASVFRDYLTNNPTATWGKARDAIKAELKKHGLDIKDSDAVPFGVAKKKIYGASGTAGHGVGNGKEVTLKQFAALTQNIDPASLNEAIKIIGQVGGIDNARTLAKKWADLCDAIGADSARKAIAVL